jgi:UMF1 family MFS transporter
MTNSLPSADGTARKGGWLEALGLHRRELRAWAMYDWANSAFATTIMGALASPFYASVAASHLPANMRTAYWAWTTSIALFIIAVISPVLGAVADYMGSKKKFLAFFAGLGILFTSFLSLVGTGQWLFASIVFIVANIGFAGANVFYESLLPNIADGREVDRVSTAGYAMGYVGGGLLLALNFLWIAWPETFGLRDVEQATRLSFFSVSVWWALFSVPLFRRVREPPRALEAAETLGVSPLRIGFRRVGETLGELRRHKQVFLFLLAFWFYNDGIGSIIKMAAIFAVEIGISTQDILLTFLAVQFLGIPFTFGFGWLAGRIGAKRGLQLSLAVYLTICIFGYFVTTPAHFFTMGLAVATVQGGSQALSRSIFATIVPKSKSSQFFGFFSVSAKFAGIFGPLLFGIVGAAMGDSRPAIVSLVIFFIIGMFFLARLDVEEGRRVAAEEDAEMRVVRES